jgi:hypothetical protein
MLRLGKLPARKNSIKFKLSDYLTRTTISTTPPTKYLTSQYYPQAWGMLGNDQYADCVFAGAGHETMFWNNEAKATVSFTDTSVLSDYTAVTGFNPNDPGSDNGTDMQVAASYRRKTGVTDATGKKHQVAAYLALRVGDVTELKQAIYLFGGVGVGFAFPASAMAQFNAGKSWSVKNGSPIEGGHYVPAIGYDRYYIYVVTWGKVQKMTWSFYKKYCDEAIVYLSEERLTGGKTVIGLDVATLQNDLASL